MELEGHQEFFSVESGSAPCLSVGGAIFWMAINNHNPVCERYIGKMALVRDSEDGSVDRRVRGSVLNQENVGVVDCD